MHPFFVTVLSHAFQVHVAAVAFAVVEQVDPEGQTAFELPEQEEPEALGQAARAGTVKNNTQNIVNIAIFLMLIS